ncbi:MAG: hypothetical protein ABIH41_03310 [Nanoarchaeota archaeon]
MSLVDIIDLMPALPVDERQGTFHDNRSKLTLLYREGTRRLDALITPFGEDIKAKHDLAIYVRFLPDSRLLWRSFRSPKLEEHALSGDRRYHTISATYSRAVMEFAAHDRFPEVIMPNSFSDAIADCNERMYDSIIRILELGHALQAKQDHRRKGTVLFPARESYSRLPDYPGSASDAMRQLRASFSGIFAGYESLREPVFKAMERHPRSPSEPLGRFERHMRHWLWSDLAGSSYGPHMARSALIRGLVRAYTVYPLRHSYYSTADNRFFNLPPEKARLDEHTAAVQHIRSVSEPAYESLARIQHEYADEASKKFLGAGIIAGGLTALTINPFIGLGIGVYSALDRAVSVRNRNESGMATGIIGSVRDAFGHRIDAPDPFSFTKQDARLGLWTRKDLEGGYE